MHGTLADLLKEVVAFVIDEDEGGEVFHFDLPDRFHAEFGEVDHFLALDVFFGKEGGGSPGGAKVESAMLLASVGDHLGAVAFGEHDHGGAVLLKEIDVGIHAPGGGGAEGAGGHPFGGLGGTGVVNRILLKVVGEVAVLLEDFLEFGMGNIAGHNDGSGEGDGSGDRILAEGREGAFHALIEIDVHTLEPPVAEFFGDEATGVLFQLFEEETVLGDLGFGLSVG